MHKNIIRTLKASFCVIMLSTAVACSFPTKVSTNLLASFDTNPDPSGRPSPLVVRIYELKSDTVFNNSDFYQLYDEEKATLGGDLVARKEFELSPGSGREIIYKVNEQARYLGVIAAFRNIDQATWRASTKLKLNTINSSIINIGKQTVSIRKN